MLLTPRTETGDELRKALRALVETLALACKNDGRVGIDGAEYLVHAIEATIISNEWEVNDDASITTEPYYHEYSSRWEGIRARELRFLSHLMLTIYIDGSKSVWRLEPLGKSVPGQRKIEQQAGSPKPPPEIIHPVMPENDDYD